MRIAIALALCLGLLAPCGVRAQDEAAASAPPAAEAARPDTASGPATGASAPGPSSQTPSSQTPSSQAATPADAESRPLAVGVLHDTPPFSMAERYGIRVGFDVDLAYAMCARVERRCRIVPLGREALFEALRDRRIDIVIASDGLSDRLESVASLSDPYLTLAARVVVPKRNRADVDSPDELPYGAVLGTPYALYLQATYPQPGAVALYASATEMWIDLALGRLQGALATAVTARTEFLSTPLGRDSRFSSSVIADDGVRAHQASIAVRKGDAALTAAINAAIDDYLKSPEYAESLARHLSGGLASAPAGRGG